MANDIAGKPGFIVRSPCGREWFLSHEAVSKDYAQFLMEQDGLSEVEAMVMASVHDNMQTWFSEQIIWEEVESLGVLIKEASPEEVQKALNFYRKFSGRGPNDDCIDAVMPLEIPSDDVKGMHSEQINGM